MILAKIKNILALFSPKREKKMDMLDYWKKRSETFGERAVINLEHKKEDFEKVTEYQKSIIYPVLKKHLTGEGKKGLDFGCGPARFSKDIASMINGHVTGVDVAPEFIKIAKINDPVNDFIVMHNNKIPSFDNEFDIIWVCLVLGGIVEDELENVKKEILRVSKKNALMILVENTTKQQNNTHWFYRSSSYYISLFTEFNLKVEKEYTDLGETISILVGRKQI